VAVVGVQLGGVGLERYFPVGAVVCTRWDGLVPAYMPRLVTLLVWPVLPDVFGGQVVICWLRLR